MFQETINDMVDGITARINSLLEGKEKIKAVVMPIDENAKMEFTNAISHIENEAKNILQTLTTMRAENNTRIVKNLEEALNLATTQLNNQINTAQNQAGMGTYAQVVKSEVGQQYPVSTEPQLRKSKYLTLPMIKSRKYCEEQYIVIFW